MGNIPMKWRDWLNVSRLAFELSSLRQGWRQHERVCEALLGRYEKKIAALEAENARLREALRECHRIRMETHNDPLCKCVGCKMDVVIRDVLDEEAFQK